LDFAAPAEAQTNELSGDSSQETVDQAASGQVEAQAQDSLVGQETEAAEALDFAAPVEPQTNELSDESSQETVEQAASGEVEAQAQDDLVGHGFEATEAVDSSVTAEAQTKEFSDESSQETVDQAAYGEVEAQAHDDLVGQETESVEEDIFELFSQSSEEVEDQSVFEDNKAEALDGLVDKFFELPEAEDTGVAAEAESGELFTESIQEVLDQAAYGEDQVEAQTGELFDESSQQTVDQAATDEDQGQAQDDLAGQDFEAAEVEDTGIPVEAESGKFLSGPSQDTVDQAAFSEAQEALEGPVVARQEVDLVEDTEAKGQEISGESKEETVLLDPPSETRSELKKTITTAQGLGPPEPGRLWTVPQVTEGSSKDGSLDGKGGGLIKNPPTKKLNNFESFVSALSAKPKNVKSSSGSSEAKVEPAEGSLMTKGESLKAHKGSSRKDSILRKMAKKYPNFDPTLFGLAPDGFEAAAEAPETETSQGIGVETAGIGGAVSVGLSSDGESTMAPEPTLANDGESVAEAEPTLANDGESVTEAVTTLASDGESVVEAVTTLANDGESVDEAVTTLASDGESVAEAVITLAKDGESVAEAVTTLANDGESVVEAVTTLANDGESVAEAVTGLAADSEFVEAPPMEEPSQAGYIEGGSESSLKGVEEMPSGGEVSMLPQAGDISSQGVVFEGEEVLDTVMAPDAGYEDDEEPLVLLDQVVDDGEYEDSEPVVMAQNERETVLAEVGAEEMAITGEIVVEGQEIQGGNGSYEDDSYDGESYDEGAFEDQYDDESNYEEGDFEGAEDQQPVQYPLEPWPANFLGTEDQPVEYQLATMEVRLFKKMQNRSYLIPQGANQANWEASKKTRLKGM
jgi:hypothetical protein